VKAGARLIVAALAIAAVTAGALSSSAARATQVSQERPNILVFETDDQTQQSMFMMTKTKSLIADHGVTFTNSFVSLSLCCPSRATFLTGQYAHNHGVLDNEEPGGGYYKLDNSNTLAVWLQRAGYTTILVGKYLNKYGTRPPVNEVPPGWSDWHSLRNLSYEGWSMNDNGRIQPQPGYQTDGFARVAADAIRNRAAGKPFFLWLTFHAPHVGPPRDPDDPTGFGTPSPAPKYRDRFADAPLPMPPSYDEQDVGDKPRAIADLPLITLTQKDALRESYQQALESLLSVDDAVQTVMDELSREQLLDDTIVMFTSDNGFLYGEHRVKETKDLLYEPSIRVPLLMRGPGIPEGLHLPQMAANVDLTPTIVEAAHASPQRVMDGRSLWPILRDPGRWLGDPLLLEGAASDLASMPFVGIRTSRYKYVEWRTGERELYDLLADRYELRNLHGNPAYAKVEKALAAELKALRTCAGDSCRPPVSVAVKQRCAGDGTVAAAMAGTDAGSVVRAEFLRNGRVIAVRTAAPFEARLKTAGPLRARVTLLDGRRVTRDAVLRACR